jgi:putative flavoprotein involved in K+ transport
VTEFSGLYAVGLPWLYSEPSSVFAGVGADAEHVVAHIARRQLTETCQAASPAE